MSMLALIHKRNEILNQNKDRGYLEFSILGKFEKGHLSNIWMQHEVTEG